MSQTVVNDPAPLPLQGIHAYYRIEWWYFRSRYDVLFSIQNKYNYDVLTYISCTLRGFVEFCAKCVTLTSGIVQLEGFSLSSIVSLHHSHDHVMKFLPDVLRKAANRCRLDRHQIDIRTADQTPITCSNLHNIGKLLTGQLVNEESKAIAARIMDRFRLLACPGFCEGPTPYMLIK